VAPLSVAASTETRDTTAEQRRFAGDAERWRSARILKAPPIRSQRPL